jgi:hypothetical protein
MVIAFSCKRKKIKITEIPLFTVKQFLLKRKLYKSIVHEITSREKSGT